MSSDPVPSASTRPRILVVDDEEDIVESLKDMFEVILGARVYTARSGTAALEVLEAGHVDLIVSDYKMPGINGLEFLEKARKLAPKVPRIMVTAFPDLEIALRAINDARIENFLTKPLDPTELVASVKELLSRQEQERRRHQAFARAMSPTTETASFEHVAGSLRVQCQQTLDVLVAKEGVIGACIAGRDGLAIVERWGSLGDLDVITAMGAAAIGAAEIALGEFSDAPVDMVTLAAADHRLVVSGLDGDLVLIAAMAREVPMTDIESAILSMRKELEITTPGT